MNQSELGIRIKQCRKLKNFTQEKLAELVNVSPHYIYEIEKGLKTMSISTLVDIASILGMSVDYLLFGTQKDSLYCNAKELPYDRLNLLLKNLSPQQRDNLADIMSVLIPHLK